MTIYTRWGSEVEVTEFCGTHQIKIERGSEPITLHLVRLRVVSGETDAKPLYRFSETLRATEGWFEIGEAVNAAKPVTLTKAALRKAIKEAR